MSTRRRRVIMAAPTSAVVASRAAMRARISTFSGDSIARRTLQRAGADLPGRSTSRYARPAPDGPAFWGVVMIGVISRVGDRLLAKLVPGLDASACTAPERECWCDRDAWGSTWICQECRYCPGTGYTCGGSTYVPNGC